MARKGSYNYFDGFIKMSEDSCKAAKMLVDIVADYDASDSKDSMKAMHVIENSADLKQHEMQNLLVKEFVTPIEREDIMQIAYQIDTVTDKVEDVLIALYMYNIKEVPEAMVEMARIVKKCCDSLFEAVKEFKNYRKSKELRKKIVDINNFEEEGDRLYMESVRNLHTNGNHETRYVFNMSAVFERLESCCDACEDVADTIMGVIMKNT